jgi:formylglycine-generating enzyme required for sulfatase activity
MTPNPFASLLLAGLLCLVPSVVWAQRVALLIGNASYAKDPLKNPLNDVRAMESALTALGFKVEKALNADQKQMKRVVRDFGTRAQGAEVAFFYYSGHGTQVDGENWLLPLGASIEKKADYGIEAVSAQDVLGQMAGAQPKTAVLVLDACRDNPSAPATKGGKKGMARMADVPTGTLVAFATQPNNTANDDGLYAQVLAAELRVPGQELMTVFRNTTAKVRLRSADQVPRISDVSLEGPVYLAGIKPEPVLPVVPPQAPQAATVPAPRPAAPAPLACAYCPEMVVIPAGSFQMGSNEYTDEKPPHRVSIKSFALGKYEVTQGQWKAVMGSNPSSFEECGDNCPVEQVSWDDIQQYIQKLNASSGQQYRLPSEAEWEYAARAGSNGKWSFGNDDAQLGQYAWYGSNSGSKTHAAGGKLPNAFGLHDMHGNVWEWVQDYYHDSYSGAPSDGSAWVAGGDQGRRVFRGGGWLIDPAILRSAIRGRYTPDGRNNDIGFRLARTLLTP